MRKTLLLIIVGIMVVSGCATRNVGPGSSSGNNNQSSASVVAGLPESQQILSEDESDEHSNNDSYLSQGDIEEMLIQSIPLTEVLVLAAPPSANEGVAELDEKTVTKMVLYAVGFEKTPYPYHDIFSADDFFHFPAQEVRRVAYELAGMYDLVFEYGDIEYNQETDEYDTTMGFGFNGAYKGENFSAEYIESETAVVVSFTLLEGTDVDGNPGFKEAGQYNAKYSIMQEEGRIFLRFAGMDKE